MTNMMLDKTEPAIGCAETEPARWTAGSIEASHGLAAEAFDGCRTDTLCAPQGKHRFERFRLNSPYGLSGVVGVVTYFAYGALNHAWDNWALVAVAVYMFLSIPLYSKASNRIETAITTLTRLETCGRLGRFVPQLIVNLGLLWVLVAGQVIDPNGLIGIGGFFATTAWITIVSQGGQYLANWLACRNIGDADNNVVLAVSISVIVNALAVSGIVWVHPIHIGISLTCGIAIFGMGLLTDIRFILAHYRT